MRWSGFALSFALLLAPVGVGAEEDDRDQRRRELMEARKAEAEALRAGGAGAETAPATGPQAKRREQARRHHAQEDNTAALVRQLERIGLKSMEHEVNQAQIGWSVYLDTAGDKFQVWPIYPTKPGVTLWDADSWFHSTAACTEVAERATAVVAGLRVAEGAALCELAGFDPELPDCGRWQPPREEELVALEHLAGSLSASCAAGRAAEEEMAAAMAEADREGKRRMLASCRPVYQGDCYETPHVRSATCRPTGYDCGFAQGWLRDGTTLAALEALMVHPPLGPSDVWPPRPKAVEVFLRAALDGVPGRAEDFGYRGPAVFGGQRPAPGERGADPGETRRDRGKTEAKKLRSGVFR